jgi:hypothetical protein
MCKSYYIPGCPRFTGSREMFVEHFKNSGFIIDGFEVDGDKIIFTLKSHEDFIFIVCIKEV